MCEEICHLRSESKNESEIDSASNEEETDDMPALTDSDMSDIGEQKRNDQSLLLQKEKALNQKREQKVEGIRTLSL